MHRQVLHTQVRGGEAYAAARRPEGRQDFGWRAATSGLSAWHASHHFAKLEQTKMPIWHDSGASRALLLTSSTELIEN